MLVILIVWTTRIESFLPRIRLPGAGDSCAGAGHGFDHCAGYGWKMT